MTARKLYRVPAFLAVVVALVAGLFLLGRVSETQRSRWGSPPCGSASFSWLPLRSHCVYASCCGRSPSATRYAIVALAAGVLVVAPTLIDKKVNEQIVTGVPASTPPTSGKADG
jgi:hypothetical protein